MYMQPAICPPLFSQIAPDHSRQRGEHGTGQIRKCGREQAGYTTRIGCECYKCLMQPERGHLKRLQSSLAFSSSCAMNRSSKRTRVPSSNEEVNSPSIGAARRMSTKAGGIQSCTVLSVVVFSFWEAARGSDQAHARLHFPAPHPTNPIAST